MKPLKIFIATVALLMVAVVGIGLALDGEWQVQRSRVVDLPAEVLFAELTSIDGWSTWGSLGAVSGAERTGPANGAGATVRWDDREWGEGEWTLTAAEPGRPIRYEARVEGGALVTRGRLELTPLADGTRIEWTEEGDFGWNPVLAYMALAMDRLQGTEMEKTLDRLEAHLRSGAGVP